MKYILGLVLLICSQSFALSPSTAAIDKTWQSVVLLKIPGPDADGDILDGYCVGTLLANDLLVTAAHCLAGSTLGNNGQMKIEVGEYQYRQRPDGTNYRTGYLTIISHPTTVTAKFVNGVGFGSAPNRISPENDFVFVHLKTPLSLPTDFIFASLWNQSIKGINLASPTLISVNPVEAITTTDTKQMAMLNQIKFSTYSAQSTSSSRVAAGDSGSPLFATINGKTQLIGVTKGLATSVFSNYDVFAIWGERAQ